MSIKKIKKSVYLASITCLLFSPSIFAANTAIGVEFYINDSTGAALDGDQSISLGLCDSSTGGTCYCQTSGSYTFDNGFLGTSLDCASDLASIPETSYLRMTVGSSTVSTEVQAVPYALSALSCSQLAPGNITINGDLTVTGSITGGSFVGVGGGSGDITSVVAGSGLSGGGVTGDVTLTAVLGASIDSAEIVDGTIATADIANDAIDATKIAPNAVDSSEIAADAVGASEIATGAVTTTEILDSTIANGDIAVDTIDFDRISDTLNLDQTTTIIGNGFGLSYQIDGTGAEQFSIFNPAGGRVFFGLNPSTGLQVRTLKQDLMVVDNANLELNLSDFTTMTQRLCHSGINGATGLVFIGDCDPAGQADIAEYYGSDGTLNPGDVVIFSGSGTLLENKEGKSTSKAYLAKSDRAYDDRILGVVSTNPFSEVLGEAVFDNSENPAPLALVGRVPVNVTNKNGAIKAGDYLTSSDIPGFAMKATLPGSTIGMVLEDFNEDYGQALMFIKPGFWTPSTESISLKGSVAIQKNEDSVVIPLSQELNSTSSVSVTPLSNPNCFYWVEKGKDSFTLKLSKKASNPITFDWMLLR